MSIRLTPAGWLARLPGPGGERWVVAAEHATLSVEFYAPRGVDPQQPHSRDEAYVIVRGTATFFDGEQRYPIEPGDFLFIPAGIPHRFEDFSDDLETWVLFFNTSITERARLKADGGSSFEAAGLRVTSDAGDRGDAALYVVVNGSGTFVQGETREPFNAGDLLFANAGVPHRLEDAGADLRVWSVVSS